MKLVRPLVVVDPGHGGSDPGAVAPDGTRESVLALKVAQEVAIELARREVRAIMTRVDDTRIALPVRATRANVAEADLFVSVHLNAALNTTARGVWVLHASGSRPGRELARQIYRAITDDPDAPERVYPDASSWTGNRKLAVLHLTKMPAALVECGFLSSPVDLRAMKAPDWPEKMGGQIASGIEAWLKLQAPRAA